MSSVPHSRPSEPYNRTPPQVFASACIIDQTPPPSLREILSAYTAKGNGDREMLLAMLNAKSAEDQRIAATLTLHRTLLETCPSFRLVRPSSPKSCVYPSQPPTPLDYDEQWPVQPPRQGRACSPGRSSPRQPQQHKRREMPCLDQGHPRKRRRASRSPGGARGATYAPPPARLHEQFLPSPRYSSDRSDSEEYSTHSRVSMTIGSLLSSQKDADAGQCTG